MLNYINNKKLTVSTAKSTVTLFTPDTHEHHLHPQVKLADQVLLLEKEAKCARSDARHPSHVHTTLQQYRSKSAATQCVESTGRLYLGLQQRNLANDLPGNWPLNTHYCCPVWTPSPKDTNWSRLQWAQNSALRITTGCPKMADVAELHQETETTISPA